LNNQKGEVTLYKQIPAEEIGGLYAEYEEGDAGILIQIWEECTIEQLVRLGRFLDRLTNRQCCIIGPGVILHTPKGEESQ
jgi:hypothetical protein